jgi:MazG family protein
MSEAPPPSAGSRRAGERFATLVEIMDRLRDPGGCPWDREQTIASLRPFLLEEAHELLAAIEADRPDQVCEELGDLLLQVVFLARLFRERGAFDAAAVAEAISAKLLRRHPHVFGSEPAADSAEVLRRWEQHKRDERGAQDGWLSDIPSALPALLQAHKLSQRAAQVGFDWDGPAAVWCKLEEELDELRRAQEQSDERVAEELGDVLFTVASLARKHGFSAEEVLDRANRRFRRRFHQVERDLAQRGIALAEATLEQLEDRWRAAAPSGAAASSTDPPADRRR